MKTQTTKIITLLIGIGLLITSCQNINTVIPSSSVTTQEEHYENYNGIEVSTAFTVDVHFSDIDEIIEIEANDNLHQYIEVEKINNVLRIRLKNGTNVRGNSTLKAHITTKNHLETYSASGASRIILNNELVAEFVSISLSGASTFTGNIDAKSISLFVDGASSTSIEGSTELLTADVSGASLINNYELQSHDVNLNLSGASQVSLTANGVIDITASGASFCRYKGDATIDHINLSGASQIIKMD